jgi:hypothetical protein
VVSLIVKKVPQAPGSELLAGVLDLAGQVVVEEDLLERARGVDDLLRGRGATGQQCEKEKAGERHADRRKGERPAVNGNRRHPALRVQLHNSSLPELSLPAAARQPNNGRGVEQARPKAV